jgi:NTE family protein
MGDEPSSISQLESHLHLGRPSEIIRCVEGKLPGALVNRVESSRSLPETRIRATSKSDPLPSLRLTDVARLKHRLRGIRLGLALGGEGAKALAHLGVLKVFEEEGIYFDQFAETSAGALASVAYSAGYSVDEILEMFDSTMQPPRYMRWLPTSKKWHLFTMFRMGLLERILCGFFGNVRLEDLLVPVHTTTVDLIGGVKVVRSEEDCVDAILESANYPFCGRPILRDGQALIDGGILANVPVRTLRERGCDFVVAVDVSSELRSSFAESTPQTPRSRMRRPGVFETLLRVADVQMRHLSSLHAADGDFLIAPDTSGFAFEDFTKGRELFEVGVRAARRMMP